MTHLRPIMLEELRRRNYPVNHPTYIDIVVVSNRIWIYPLLELGLRYGEL